MRRLAPWTAILMLALPAAAENEAGEVKPVAAGISVVQGSGAERFDVPLGGVLLSFVVARTMDGSEQIFILVKPPAPVERPPERSPAGPVPRSLLRVDLDGGGSLVPIRERLPKETGGLVAADLDGDGRDELLLARPGALLRVGMEKNVKLPGEGEPWITDRDLDLTGFGSAFFHRPGPGGSRRLWIPVVGALRGYGPGENGEWTALDEIPLPVTARLNGAELHVEGPRVRAPKPHPVEPGVVVAGPENAFGRRLHTWILDPGGKGESRRIECWARLPGDERVRRSEIFRLGDRPVLLVLTSPRKGINLFGEQKLRLFDLKPDRTRVGHPPRFAVETRVNTWQTAFPIAADLNRDGRDDLILAYWKGNWANRAALDVYLRREDGSFRRSPRSTVISVKDANRSYLDFGDDVNGDGLPDLVLLAAGEWRAYPGLPWNGSANKPFVAATPRWNVVLPKGAENRDTRILSVGTSGVEATEYTSANYFYFGRVDHRRAGPALFLFSRPDGKGGTLLHVVRVPAGGNAR